MWLVLLGGCDCGSEEPAPDCEKGETACGRACFALGEDPFHCGGCDVECAGDEVCFGGTCRAGCPPGTDPCDRTCRALESDPANCGACGTACAQSEECDRGACACPDGLDPCGGTCVDLATDESRCGACDAPCAPGESCVGGVCGCRTERRETSCADGADDDCDALADCEDPDCAGSVVACEDACGAGVRRCEGADRGACLGGAAAPETCGNGIDDDCDGESLAAPDSLEPTDTCDECYRLGTDPTFEVAATIDSVLDASDCYSFGAVDDARFAERIEVRLESLPPAVDLDLHLYRGADACEARRPTASSLLGPGEDERVQFVETFDADESDEWYVRVVRVSGFSCDDPYSLVVSGLL